MLHLIGCNHEQLRIAKKIIVTKTEMCMKVDFWKAEIP